ncbi:MAG: tRNA(His) guanylyltransferase Thg1 family protein [bacterium]
MEYRKLEDWSKWLEKNFSNEIMIPILPVIIRLDGNNFSKWTKDLNKPFDADFSYLMIETTKFLVKETNALIGYTQSDEITLILYSNNRQNQIYHNGKKQKILSKLTGNCVNFFNENRKDFLCVSKNPANFDARIYQTPTLQDAVGQLIWRENDAVKNSVSMLAQSLYSHQELMNINTSDLYYKMIKEHNVDWKNLPIKFQRGSYIKRTQIEKKLDVEELNQLPEKHLARQNPDMMIKRSVIREMHYPPINQISNMVDVVFHNENLKLKQTSSLFRYP